MEDRNFALIFFAVVAIIAVVGLVLFGSKSLTVQVIPTQSNGDALSSASVEDSELNDGDNQLTGEASIGKTLKKVTKKATKSFKKLPKAKLTKGPGSSTKCFKHGQNICVPQTSQAAAQTEQAAPSLEATSEQFN